jgi:selenocysteine lyase/cysteine desulfurase
MNMTPQFSDQTESRPLAAFEAALRAEKDPVAALRAGLIGKGIAFDGRFGPRKLVYADYVASGRALEQVERFIMNEVLPFYANSHTEASHCGGVMTRMREDARKIILNKCHGDSATHAVIFAGSGATLGLNKLVHLLGVRAAVAEGRPAHILVGPYEHHSNLLPWRESGAEVIEIAECASGGPDPVHLQQVLDGLPQGGLVVGAFSAASNVTGIGADIPGITRIVKQAGGKVVWDYAGGGPYLPIHMSPEGAEIDAISTSPHKFLGGPGASGVLIVRRDAVQARVPSIPGGGTVAFVNSRVQDYLSRIEDREEGGTPNIVGDIRAALVFIVKAVLGQAFITARNAELTEFGLKALDGNPAIAILGGVRSDRLPIFSVILADSMERHFDYQLFTRALSDLYGVQVRGGCACAGPYVHRLLNIGDERSKAMRQKILAGDESDKPGFVRFNLSVLMTDEEASFVLFAINETAAKWQSIQLWYKSQAAA